MGLNLWEHQREAVERARGKDHFGLFFEMGAGKTATAIHILREIYNKEGRILRTLVLGPSIVIANWKKEFLLHSKIPAQKIIPIIGTGKQRLEKAKGHADSVIMVTNYQSLLMPELFQFFEEGWRPEIIIFDESHRLKNPSAKTSKAAVKLAQNARYRYILTGTPVLNTPMDLFNQFLLMDLGRTFGKNFFVFRNTYFYDKNAGMPSMKYFPNWTPKPNCIKDINEKMKHSTMTKKKEECLELPPLIKEPIETEMGKDQKKHYEEMKRDLITFLGDEACTATLALTKALRLQQIVSGFIVAGNTVVRFKENPRAAALEELLEDITPSHKVIVWCVFKENYQTVREVCEKLKIKSVEVHGEISAKQKDANVELFNTDPSVRVFIGHPRSGGIGINLVSSPYSIFYSRSFSLEDDLQAEARNHRGGSEIHEKITRYDLFTPGTIDELVLNRLQLKQALGDALLEDIKKEINHESNDGRRVRTNR